MAGRDPHESHRAATPLELLFDLTFVVAYGLAADELAHYLAEDHLKAALLGFALRRLRDHLGVDQLLVVRVGVRHRRLDLPADDDGPDGRACDPRARLPDVFESIDEGETVNNDVMVAGYVVMRVAMVFQWARAARQDPQRRSACQTYVPAILIAQVGWIALAIAHTSVARDVPVRGRADADRVRRAVSRRDAASAATPWHAHHIAERYGLLIIIALGEGIIGTIASLSAIVGPEGPGWIAGRRAGRDSPASV